MRRRKRTGLRRRSKRKSKTSELTPGGRPRVTLLGIVLDTCVVASGVKSKNGASHKLLSLMESGKFEFHLSVPLVCEYQDVLKRPEIGAIWSEEDLDELLDV